MNIKDIFSLRNKTVVITGGAGHLGSGMSEALAAFGAQLFILGKNTEKNKKKAEELKVQYNLTVCESMAFDINNEVMIENCLSKIFSLTGSIDVLINNAAYSSSGRTEKMSLNEWHEGINGTINCTFCVTREVLKYMIKAKKGNIVNIGSMYGMVAPDPEIYGDSGYDNPANYGAGKAAIIQFTKYLAATYGRVGIRSNVISPGPFPDVKTQQNEMFIQNLCRKNPMNRVGEPEDLYGAIVYLASDASSYLNGQNIAIDGGWTAW